MRRTLPILLGLCLALAAACSASAHIGPGFVPISTAMPCSVSASSSFNFTVTINETADTDVDITITATSGAPIADLPKVVTVPQGQNSVSTDLTPTGTATGVVLTAATVDGSINSGSFNIY